jgi:MFS family permease
MGTEGKSRNKIPFVVIMLGLVSLLTDSATEMIYPLIPAFITALGAGAIILGIIEGLAETTAALLKLVSGIISDRLGKRKLLVVIGYSISSFIRPLTGLVASAWQIVFIRMFDRVGKGIRTAPRDALIASSTNEKVRGRSYGFHRAMDNTGAVIGPVLAIIALIVIITGFGIKDSLVALRWTFLFAFIPGILSLLILVLYVRENAQGRKSNGSFILSFRHFDSNFKRYLIIVLIFTLGNSSDAFLLFRVEESIKNSGAVVNLVKEIPFLNNLIGNLGSVNAQAQIINILFLPLVWAFFNIIKAVLSTPFGALSDRTGRKIIINIGWGIYVFVYASFALLVFLPAGLQIIATFVLFAVYALFYALTEGTEKALVADMVEEEYRGTAFGLFNFSIGLGALPASVIFGLLYSFFDSRYPGYGGSVAFGFGAMLALISMILLSAMVKEPSEMRSRAT